MSIEFTQYMLPDGRTQQVKVDRPDDIEMKAKEIVDAGYRFEIEVLNNGKISTTIRSPDDGDIDIVVSTNGPSLLIDIDAMITRFHATLTQV